ncbi:DegV family protein [Mediterraneibacter glycyrrhizinilyticus]|uniref:DegV family protein n=1 Tax=Mediterraneibacter glycyrrhizinilyticus TaxID=342942 RepID=UPI0025AA79E2|nr:DegV family protein [Mediterraneibacter glycyrrhizinilyticus]MCF2569185.1 DegV family protein [Mediterraneibacter glycyrrhizinilyticus]MDN0044460.1 DegV family protein [Mediterraneibacter glycyrrhizinilyticus]
MADYVITTDSNSDVLPEFIKENDLTIIPQYYSFGDTVYGDELNMPPHEFYETMRKGELPKSQANNPAVIREKFEKILKEGKNILHIAFSSALSGSCNNVVMTANELLEDYPDRKIMVFDSLNASLGEGVSVYRAVELWKEEKSMEEVYDILMEERDHVNVSFTVNDLYHLQRGGRVSKTTAVVGSLVNIKPILAVTSTGELKSDGTVRGRKKSLKTLVARLEESLDLDSYGKDRLVAVLHGDCIDDAKAVADMVKELGFTNVIINDVSPSIGTHAGPGVVGLINYGKKRK